MFVDPETPGGDPAVMTTVSPFLQRPYFNSSSSTWSTIASVDSTCGPRNVSTPHVRFSCERVAGSGVNASSGIGER